MPGNSAQEFEAGDAVVAGGRGDQDAGRTAAAMERGLVELLDFRERLAEADDDSGYAAVADDQIGAEAECHQGYVRIELSQELDEVVLIGRLEQPLGRPAPLEPYERSEWSVGGQTSPRLDQLFRSS